MSQPLNLFLNYHNNTQDYALVLDLRTALAPLVKEHSITLWGRDNLTAGETTSNRIDEELKKAHLVVLLISPDYLADNECLTLQKRAIEADKTIVPVLLRPCGYLYNPDLKDKHFLPINPKNGKPLPISSWKRKDDALQAVVEGIAGMVTDTQNNITRALYKSNRPQNNKTTLKQSPYYENGYALLIGVGADLTATVNDAQALYDLLTDTKIAAFNPANVQLLTEEKATRNGILDALETLRQQVSENKDANVIISYAGHGCVTEDGKAYYLTPYDYIRGQAAMRLWSNDFTDAVNKIVGKKKLIILDCCHAGGVREQNNNNHTALIKQLEKGGGSAIIAACKDDESALDLEKEKIGIHGLFTQVLLNALKTPPNRTNNNGFIHLTDIMAYFAANFKKELDKVRPGYKQHPIISKLEQYNLSEDFVVCAYDIVQARGGGETPPPVVDETKKKLSREDYFNLIDTDMDAAFRELDKLDWGNRRGTYNDLKGEWIDPPMGFNKTHFRSRLKTFLNTVL